ncbi:MAG TPA: VOC family protein [Gemmatimonadaceae bacterium]|jgi:PhnB protein
MKAIHSYLNFDGTTADAMKFYHGAFGGDLQMQTFADMKMEAHAPGAENRVIHARLGNGTWVLMASDTPPGMGVNFGNNVHLNLDCESKDEVDRLMKALGDSGTVTMPAQDMFWGAYFGMLKDKFGVHWMFNAESAK